MTKKLTLFVAACAFLFVSSCGTLLKPEQRNRAHSGNIDSTILILDGVGLIFFLLPGIVAFTVDYLNGTLYLPKKAR